MILLNDRVSYFNIYAFVLSRLGLNSLPPPFSPQPPYMYLEMEPEDLQMGVEKKDFFF